MRKAAITMILIIGVIFAFSSCAHLGGDYWVGAWASASQEDIDAFKKEIKALYAGMSETQWDAFISEIEKATGVSNLPRGNPDNWNDAQWARLYNALKDYEASEAAGNRTWNSWLTGLRASIPGVSGGTAGGGTTSTAGSAAAGSGTTAGGTAAGSTAGSGAISSTPPAQFAEGTAGYSAWSIFNRYSSNLILTNAQQYTVVSGDQMRLISERFYGNQLYYPLILLANRDQVVDPALINVGMVLTIPDLNANLNNPASLQSIKETYRDVAALRRAEGSTAEADSLLAFGNGL